MQKQSTRGEKKDDILSRITVEFSGFKTVD